MQLNWPQTTDHLRTAVEGIAMAINHNGVHGVLIARTELDLLDLVKDFKFKTEIDSRKFCPVRLIKLSDLAALPPSERGDRVSTPIQQSNNPTTP